jgi:hypothetical protein
MAKFKIALKVTGLELQIEGSRDDVPLMAHAAGQQLMGLFMPASNVVEGEFSSVETPALPAPPSQAPRNSKKGSSSRSKGRSMNGTKPNGATSAEAIDWVHDPAKWGVPKQEWNTATKAMWLLYVVSREKGVGELSPAVIVATFNKHFRQSGQILANNTSRDLGKLKTKAPALVAEDTTREPKSWFLTQAGIGHAQKLVEEALGRTASTEANAGQ